MTHTLLAVHLMSRPIRVKRPHGEQPRCQLCTVCLTLTACHGTGWEWVHPHLMRPHLWRKSPVVEAASLCRLLSHRPLLIGLPGWRTLGVERHRPGQLCDDCAICYYLYRPGWMMTCLSFLALSPWWLSAHPCLSVAHPA